MVVMLTACASNDSITTGEYEKPTTDALVCKVPIDVEPIQPIQWRDFKWKVLSTSIVEQMIEDGEDVRYFALTTEDFKNQSLTAQDILRYLRVQEVQKQQILEYYRVESSD